MMNLENVEFEQVELINKAYNFAKMKHDGQKDDCGKDYFNEHILQVFRITSIISNDPELLCASLLHDTIEDTETTYEELCKEFNKEIADLVMEMTHEGQKDNYGFYFPRLRSHKGILIKFADRLSNLSRMESWNEKRKSQYLRRSKFWKDGEDRND